MIMTKEEFIEFLKTDEGKDIIGEMEKPLKLKNQELLDEVKTAKLAVTDLKTAEEKRTADAATATRQAEEARLKDGNDFDAYKAFHDTEIAKRDTEVSELKNMFAKTEVDRLVAETASANSQNPRPLQYLLKERISAGYGEDGKLAITIKDAKGEPMYFDGQPAGIGHLVDSLKADESNASFFSASGSSGSGTSSNDSDTTTQGNYKDMSSESFNLTKAMGNKTA